MAPSSRLAALGIAAVAVASLAPVISSSSSLVSLLRAGGNPCLEAPFKAQPWCDPSAATAVRAADLVSRIPDDEKTGLFENGSPSTGALDIPAYQWWSEALHGVANSPGVRFGGSVPYATSFPQVCLTACAFNKTLWHAIGATISTEGRAMHNLGRAGLTYWAPNVRAGVGEAGARRCGLAPPDLTLPPPPARAPSPPPVRTEQINVRARRIGQRPTLPMRL